MIDVLCWWWWWTDGFILFIQKLTASMQFQFILQIQRNRCHSRLNDTFCKPFYHRLFIGRNINRSPFLFSKCIQIKWTKQIQNNNFLEFRFHRKYKWQRALNSSLHFLCTHSRRCVTYSPYHLLCSFYIYAYKR